MPRVARSQIVPIPVDWSCVVSNPRVKNIVLEIEDPGRHYNGISQKEKEKNKQTRRSEEKKTKKKKRELI